MSNSSFFHSVFYPCTENSFLYFIKFKIVVCKLFQVWKSLKFVVCERVLIIQDMKNRVFQLFFQRLMAVIVAGLRRPLTLTKLMWKTEFNTPFPNKPWFLRVCSKHLLKALWENEKLLVTSNFSFSHSAFYPFGELSAIFIKIKIVICKLFEFGIV